MKKTIFGFVGQMASGKGEAAEYLKTHHHADTHRFSTMLRETLDRFYLPQERENLVKLSEVLRSAFGNDLLAKTMVNDLRKSAQPLIVVEGIRRVADLEGLKDLPEFILVAIDVDLETRFSRLKIRAENVGDAEKTYEQFIADQARSTEQTIPEVLALATERIHNNGSREDFYLQLDALVHKYR